MNVIEKVERVKVLKSEIRTIRKDLQIDMFDYVNQEFRKLGFINDPRGEMYNRSLYNPELKISIRIGIITENSASINIFDMVDGGMNFGMGYTKIKGGSLVRFNYNKNTFGKFYNGIFTKRVKSMTQD